MHRFWYPALLATAAAAVAELVSAFMIDVPAVALVMAAVYVAGGVWLVRGRGVGGLVLLALANLVEVVGVPTYERHSVTDWAMQLFVGTVCLIGLAAALIGVVERRRAPGPPSTQSARL